MLKMYKKRKYALPAAMFTDCDGSEYGPVKEH